MNYAFTNLSPDHALSFAAQSSHGKIVIHAFRSPAQRDRWVESRMSNGKAISPDHARALIDTVATEVISHGDFAIC